MIERIAYHLGRNDEEPNVRLAERLVAEADEKGIAEIAEGLDAEPEQAANDCVKVLYEIAYRNPRLIVPHIERILSKVKSRNNRMVWGTCIALSLVADLEPDRLYRELDVLFKVYETGSVITRDNCVSIFAGIIKGNRNYLEKIFPLILRHLRTCRPKEVAQHAERALVCVGADNSEDFKKVLLERYDALADPQKKRVAAVLKKTELLGEKPAR